MRKVICSASAILILGATLLFAAQTPQPTQAQPSEEIPVTDGTSGPCSIEFTVTDSTAKPVYAARIDVHMEYGFAGAHKLDMGVYTNSQGKARFTGIPAKVRNPPIEFHAKKQDLVGVATMDPVSECQARHDIVLAKGKPPAQ
ncbi:MAG TPA: hypothetical protein VGP65_01605 [Candidatus Angelobacter sp.]|nr:hypothetical protein [Candidatus Angelobacter sp.]